MLWNSEAATSIAIFISLPGTYPAASIASTNNSRGSSFPSLQLGANPPSSPTLVLYPFFFNTVFNAWNVSAAIRTASFSLLAPTGMIMNSWKSTVESA